MGYTFIFEDTNLQILSSLLKIDELLLLFAALPLWSEEESSLLHLRM
jgi:hypothetical protein